MTDWRALCSVLALAACNSAERPEPPRREIRSPTAIVGDTQGRWLYLANGDLDASQGRSSILAINRPALVNAIRNQANGCRYDAVAASKICELLAFAQPHPVALPSGVSSLFLDDAQLGAQGGDQVGTQAETSGVSRLLAIARGQPSLTWMDVREDASLWCAQDASGACTGAHVLPMPIEPAHIVGDRAGFRYAYVPHLLERRLSLIRLDGDFGPEVVDVVEEFFSVDPFFNTKLGGGFAVAQLPCHAEPPYVPAASSQCRRPSLYASERFGLGVRTFSVAPGRAAILAGEVLPLAGVDPFSEDPPKGAGRPLMGDLAVVETSHGPLLVGVQVSPPLLFSVDVSLDAAGIPLHRVMGTVPLCDNPNRLVVSDFDVDRPLALVTCTSEGRLAAIDVAALLPIRTIDVGAGANAMWLDRWENWLWVVNAHANTVAVIDLDRSQPSFLHRLAQLGSAD